MAVVDNVHGLRQPFVHGARLREFASDVDGGEYDAGRFFHIKGIDLFRFVSTRLSDGFFLGVRRAFHLLSPV